ncbi:MAG: adenosine deaminase [Vulcanimicrobiota bacterium]
MVSIQRNFSPTTPSPTARACGCQKRPDGDQVTIGGRETSELSGRTIAELCGSGVSKEAIFAQLDQALASVALAPLSGLRNEQLRQFSQDVPKTDLHRHLEGAITPEALADVAKKNDIELPTYDVEELRELIQITAKDKDAAAEDGLKVFLEKFNLIGKIFKDPQVIEDLTYHVAKDCSDDNLQYAELRFSPMYMASTNNLDLDAVTQAVLKGAKRASQDFGMDLGLIMIIERQMGVESGWVVEKLAEKYKDAGVVALDLANNEYDYPPGPYKEVFQAAKQAGLGVTVHAGEVPVHHADKSIGGANNVRVAVEELGADRIGHGVRSSEDPAVEQMMIDKGIPYEICPLSNVQTQAVKDMASHPLPDLMRKGAVVTVNNDDPGVSGITLTDDYVNITQAFGFSATDLRQLVDNGVNSAFATDEVKDRVRTKVEEGFAFAQRRLVESMTLDELQGLALSGAKDDGQRAAIRQEFSNLEGWLSR